MTKARDLRAILAAGSGVPLPTASGSQLGLALPPVPERPLSAYALTSIGALS